MLGRFGAKPGDPWLLDRDYTTGWLLVAAVVVAAAAVDVVYRARRTRSHD